MVNRPEPQNLETNKSKKNKNWQLTELQGLKNLGFNMS